MCHIDNLVKNRFEAATLKKTNMVEEADVSGAAIIAHHVTKGMLVFSSSLPSRKYFALHDVSSHGVALRSELVFEKFS